MTGDARVLVLTLGNRDAGDDAFGPSVAEALRSCGDTRALVIDLGSGGASALLDDIEGARGLILVDAVRGPGLEMGGLVDVDWRDPQGPTLAIERVVSSHTMPVREQLRLANLLGILPKNVRIIGVATGSVALGDGMSPAVRKVVPEAAARVVEWVRKWSKS